MECLKVLFLMFICVHSESTSKTPKLEKIQFKRDFANYTPFEDFVVVWNVPSYLCEKLEIGFEETLKNFKISVNSGDKFRGEKIVLLYDPGLFPVKIKYPNGTVTKKNGGIPQKGNLNDHLKAFEEDLKKLVPLNNFSGLGVIDFEVWRPIFRQNWNDQVVYKNMSLEWAKNRTSNLSNKELQKAAAKEFEDAAKNFMEETLKLAKKLRPKAKWGYYGYSYCYGFRVNRTGHCPPPVPKENNQIRWLFKESTALYPSIYVSSNLTTEEQKQFYLGKLNEVWRMASSVSTGTDKFPPVFPYFWFRYNNEDKYLSTNDTKQALEVTKQYQMGGLIIWGSSQDVKTEEKCKNLLKYVKDVLGPAVLDVKEKNKQNNIKPS